LLHPIHQSVKVLAVLLCLLVYLHALDSGCRSTTIIIPTLSSRYCGRTSLVTTRLCCCDVSLILVDVLHYLRQYKGPHASVDRVAYLASCFTCIWWEVRYRDALQCR
jgi:hypothetical protein